MSTSSSFFLFQETSPVARCWKRTTFHIYEQLLLSEILWRCWARQLLCGNYLHLREAAVLSLLFSAGLLGSKSPWRVGLWTSLSALIISWSFILAPPAQQRLWLLPMRCAGDHHHHSGVSPCTGSQVSVSLNAGSGFMDLSFLCLQTSNLGGF